MMDITPRTLLKNASKLSSGIGLPRTHETSSDVNENGPPPTTQASIKGFVKSDESSESQLQTPPVEHYPRTSFPHQTAGRIENPPHVPVLNPLPEHNGSNNKHNIPLTPVSYTPRLVIVGEDNAFVTYLVMLNAFLSLGITLTILTIVYIEYSRILGFKPITEEDINSIFSPFQGLIQTIQITLGIDQMLPSHLLHLYTTSNLLVTANNFANLCQPDRLFEIFTQLYDSINSVVKSNQQS